MSLPRACRRSLASNNSFFRAYFSTSRVSAAEGWAQFERANRPERHPLPGEVRKGPFGGLKPKERREVSKHAIDDLTVTDYNIYGDTEPPTPHQLECANRTFAPSRHPPIHLWSSSNFRLIPPSDVPEVAFIGRSNAGKSSLINALAGSDVCRVSKTLGFTTAFHAFGIGGKTQLGSKVALVDFPGYGKASVAHWGQEFLKYVERRKQLRRVFVLVCASTGLKTNDIEVLKLLNQYPISYQIVLNKVDKVIIQGKGAKNASSVMHGFHGARLSALDHEHDRLSQRLSTCLPPSPGLLRDILACNAKKDKKSNVSLGMDAVRWAILRAAGLEQVVAPDPKLG